MDYSLITPKEIFDRFENSPDNIKELLESSSTLEIVRQICRSNYLTDEDKMVTVEQLTTLVLLGFLLSDEVGRELANNLHLNHKVSQAISEEISEKIFSPIKDQLKKIYAPVIGKSSGGTMEAPQGEILDAGTLGTQRGSVEMLKNKAVEKLKHASIQEKVSILKEAVTGGYINEIPDLQQHLKESEFKLYNEDKTYQDIADKSGLSLKNLVEEKKAVSNPAGPQTSEVIQKISAYFKRLPEPGELDSFFKDQKVAGFFPFGMDRDELGGLQQEIIKGVISSFSPEVMAGFFLRLATKDRLDNFSEAAKRLALKESDFAPANLAWISNQAAQPLGVGRQIFGIN